MGSWNLGVILDVKIGINTMSPFFHDVYRNGFHSDSSTDSDSDSDISGNEEHEVSSSGSKEKRSGQSECEPPPHSMGFPLGGTGYFPHVQITLKSTKEVAGYNTISEALYRLDFYNAIRDIRRFNYVCKLLQLLINQSLTSLSGCATRVLFSMLEQIASQGLCHMLSSLTSSWLMILILMILRWLMSLLFIFWFSGL